MANAFLTHSERQEPRKSAPRTDITEFRNSLTRGIPRAPAGKDERDHGFKPLQAPNFIPDECGTASNIVMAGLFLPGSGGGGGAGGTTKGGAEDGEKKRGGESAGPPREKPPQNEDF